jgi:alkylation response protein AidB-like acyl-CoA dehydrogenase
VTDEQFRSELRAWLREHEPPAGIDIPATPEEEGAVRAWHRTLHEGGWVGIHWPVEYGGRGASPAQTAIYNEELARAGAPPLLARGGITLVAPTLMAHGTPEQRARWIPRILTGDDVWCQLFSEPGAGSDLAGLSTRAERHVGTYLVNGQKVWSSYARFANWGIALVRTDVGAAKSHGISMLAIPMDAPGVERRPLRQMTGECEFNEVFLTDVEIPCENLIGPENEGWRVANTTLANERGASFIWKEQVLHELAMDRLLDECKRRGQLGDPLVRQQVVQSWIEVAIFKWHNARTLSRLARGETLGADSSVVKLFWANTSQRLYNTAVATLGPRGATDGPWTTGLLASRATSIMGGTSEIQRNIIGERVLGLPREPNMGSAR